MGGKRYGSHPEATMSCHSKIPTPIESQNTHAEALYMSLQAGGEEGAMLERMRNPKRIERCTFISTSYLPYPSIGWNLRLVNSVCVITSLPASANSATSMRKTPKKDMATSP